MSAQAAERWSGASYERIAETFASIHERVTRLVGAGPGTRVLDLACGTGGVALRAAAAGAAVVGLDISPDQLAKGRRAAEERGLAVVFDEGDCQALPYGDASFDGVASVFGVVFAERHELAARELARVTRPGGRLAITAWRPDSWSELGDSLGRPRPPGDDDRAFADEGYATRLLGESFELGFEHGEWTLRGRPEELWELCSTSAPPLRAWLATLDEERLAEVERAYLELFAPGELRRPYLLVRGTRR